MINEVADMLQKSPLTTPTSFSENAVRDITAALTLLLADVFAVYLKTKNFHWHMSGPHFRDYHLMLDDQGEQIFAMTDEIAERARKIGGTTIRSIGQISRLQRIADNNAEYVGPLDMIEACSGIAVDLARVAGGDIFEQRIDLFILAHRPRRLGGVNVWDVDDGL